MVIIVKLNNIHHLREFKYSFSLAVIVVMANENIGFFVLCITLMSVIDLSQFTSVQPSAWIRSSFYTCK